MSKVIRPPRLHPGDKVAVVAPSQSLAGVYPKVYAAGLASLRDSLCFLHQPAPDVTMAALELGAAGCFPERRRARHAACDCEARWTSDSRKLSPTYNYPDRSPTCWKRFLLFR